MPNIEVHGRVLQLQPGEPGVGQHMAERKQKVEIFRAQYPESYTGEANTYVHPTIADTMQKYDKIFAELHIIILCKLAGVKFTN